MKAALCLGLAAAAVVAVAGEAQDLRALKALKSAITNWDAVKGSAGWTGWENDNPCPGQGSGDAWVGVECDYSANPARVRSLNLAQLGPHTIQGTLPADLDYLNAAVYITLDGQDFTGPLPPTWGANGGFAGLESLSIAQTKVSGPLPATWATSGGWKKCHTISLYGNQLEGDLPVEWGNPNALPALHTFTVSDNKLTGSLPNSWATGFQKITELNLARNKFTGRLPYAWSFPVINNLELEGNQLSGPIGQANKWPEQMPMLKRLDLTGNMLDGSIPGTWDSFSLTNLMLFPGNKGLCGNITPKLAKAPDGNGMRVMDTSKADGLTKTSTGGYTFDAKNCVEAPAPMTSAMPMSPGAGMPMPMPRPTGPLPEPGPRPTGPAQERPPPQPTMEQPRITVARPSDPPLPVGAPMPARPQNAAPIMPAGAPEGGPAQLPELPAPQGEEPPRPPLPTLPRAGALPPMIAETAARAARIPRPMGPP